MSKFLIAIFVLSLQTTAWSKNNFDLLTPAKIRALLGDYPARGSAAETADFNELHRLQNSRTEEECAQARAENKTDLATFFAGPKGPLTKEEASMLNVTVLRHYAEAGVNILIAKRVYKRPRPYLTDPDLKPCAHPENSYAYPSGHTAMARAFAHMLARVYPDRAEALHRRANEISFNRVLGGVHHPSDIVAGKKLGDKIADIVIRRGNFVKEAKALLK